MKLNLQKKNQKQNAKEENRSLATEHVFSDGDSYFKHIIDDIDRAQKCIQLETYIFEKDFLGKQIVTALSKAATRGVSVQILVDGAGSPLLSTSYAATIEKAGGQVCIYHPFPWQLWNYSRSYIKLPILLKWIYLFLKVNKRNHRKVCIIDNKIAYIGSMNISKDHMSHQAGGHNWRDTSIRLEHVDLENLSKAFESAFSHRTIKERLRDIFHSVRHNPIFRLNYTWIRRRVLYKDLLRRIRRCEQRIWITNAYFVPDNFLLRRLKEAANHGVDVRILLPKKSDVFVMPWASSTFYYSLLKAGVRILEYLPSNLHAKTLILDNWMLIGSSNLNYRSLLHDLEVDVNVRQKKSKDKLVALFLEDLNVSKEISIHDLGANRPWIYRWLGRIVLYLKYWI